MSAIKSFAWTVFTKGLGLGLVLIVGAILYRKLGPTGKGTVEALVGWGTMLLLLAPSMEEPQLYLLGKKERPASALFCNALILSLLGGAWIWGCFEALVVYLPELLTIPGATDGERVSMDLDSLRLLVLATPFVIAQKLVGGLLQGLRDLKSFNWIFLGHNLALLAFVLALVLGLDLGWKGALYAQMIAMACGGCLAIGLALRHPAIRSGPFRIEGAGLLTLAVQGLKLHGGVAAAWVIIESDRLVINGFRATSEVAIYGIAVVLTGHLRRLIVQPAKEVLGSRLPGMVDDPALMLRSIAKTTRHTLLMVLLTGLLLGISGQLVIFILAGPEFLDAYWPLLVLLPGNLVWAAAVMMSYWFIGEGRYLQLTLVGIFIAAANLTGNLIFVPEHGLIAAAWTSSACYLVHFAIFAAIIRARTGASPLQFVVFRREDLKLWTDSLATLRAKVRRK